MKAAQPAHAPDPATPRPRGFSPEGGFLALGFVRQVCAMSAGANHWATQLSDQRCAYDKMPQGGFAMNGRHYVTIATRTVAGSLLVGLWLLSLSSQVSLASTVSRSLDEQYRTFSQATPSPNWQVSLPLVMKNYCPPIIEFTYVPPYGSFENLQGKATCVTTTDYKVAVYIYVSGWWTKPYFATPLTTIQSDGSWTADITTGGSDQLATQIAAFLVSNSYTPTLMSGGQVLPQELFDNSAAHVITSRTPVFRMIEFSGLTWKVKASETRTGPGPNYFSDSENDVWVDENGDLHMKIVYRGGRWYCTEVITADPLGYGIYTFTLASRVDLLDKNVILGLFTWDDTAPEHNYREIDIEFSRWGEDEGENAQYVVQPWDHLGSRHQFNVTLSESTSSHYFDWRADKVQFSSVQDGNELESWQYIGSDLPPEGAGNARINLCLLNGNPPSDGQEVEVVIRVFEFTP